MPSVLQSWLENIPVRMQSTLLLGLRGFDSHDCPHVKKVQRWLRGLSFRPGNPANVREFMATQDQLPSIAEKGALAKELEHLPQHFYSHLMHALQVIAFRHPQEAIRDPASVLYTGMVSLLHLDPESESMFAYRLREISWPGGAQPDTLEEALSLIAVPQEESKKPDLRAYMNPPFQMAEKDFNKTLAWYATSDDDPSKLD